MALPWWELPVAWRQLPRLRQRSRCLCFFILDFSMGSSTVSPCCAGGNSPLPLSASHWPFINHCQSCVTSPTLELPFDVHLIFSHGYQNAALWSLVNAGWTLLSTLSCVVMDGLTANVNTRWVVYEFKIKCFRCPAQIIMCMVMFDPKLPLTPLAMTCPKEIRRVHKIMIPTSNSDEVSSTSAKLCW